LQNACLIDDKVPVYKQNVQEPHFRNFLRFFLRSS